jgi:NAD(P)-dependent dehydrogenase (short-subunit alcohol dehydrogenase family)
VNATISIAMATIIADRQQSAATGLAGVWHAEADAARCRTGCAIHRRRRREAADMNTPKVAVITGGGTGVGRACALALAAEGFTIVVSGRRQDVLDTVLDELDTVAGNAGGHIGVQADVADPGSVEALFGVVEQTFGRIDLLFNNAGTGAPAVPIDELTFEQWQRVVDTNLTGAFLCAQGAIGLMKRQTPPGGRIINNGSISAHTPRPHSAPYTATKHAITGLTKSIALDGRPFGIACGQIDIGNAATSMTDRMTAGVLQADGTTRPEPRMATDDVARAVVYMASLPPDANVLTMTVMATGMPFVGRG